jgi:hypothetical protein
MRQRHQTKGAAKIRRREKGVSSPGVVGVAVAHLCVERGWPVERLEEPIGPPPDRVQGVLELARAAHGVSAVSCGVVPCWWVRE